jgi:biopolymer transport protein ExbD
MRRSHAEAEYEPVYINVVPLIDVMFFLVLFFVSTASFVRESGIEINRPSAQTAVVSGKDSMIVSIARNGQIWIDNQQVDVRLVRAHVERMHSENPAGAVIILADKDSATGTVVEVMDQVHLAGVTNVAIAASRK